MPQRARKQFLRRLLRSALPAAAVVVAAGVVVSTLLVLSESRWAGPVGDFWLFVPKLAAFEKTGRLWSIVWEPYGGHRLVLPKLLYLIEYGAFGGRNLFLVSCNVVFQALTATLLVVFAWRHGAGLSTGERVFLGAVSVLLLFSGTQLENFSRGWNVHHFLACGGAVASLLALGLAAETSAETRAGRGSWLWLAVSSLCAVAASFSMAIALPVWPILLLVAWRSGLSRGQVAALAGVAVVVLTAFLSGHRAATGGAFDRRLDDPLAFLQFAVACLGSPLSWRQPELGMAVTVLALLGVAAFGVSLLVSGRRPSALEILYPSLVLLGAGAALLTAYGRVAGHTESWDAHRYQSFTLLFWLGVFGVGTLASAGGGWRRGLRAALAVAAVAWVGGALLPAHFQEARAVRQFASQVRVAHDAILVGVSDREAYLDSLPKILWARKKPDMAAFSRPYLERRELGMFADGRHHRLGLRIGEDLDTAPESACHGGVGQAGIVAGFPRLMGGVDGGGEILISDADGLVVGLGRAHDPCAPSGTKTGWTAWAQPTDPETPLIAWTLLPDGRACPLRGRGRSSVVQIRRSVASQ